MSGDWLERRLGDVISLEYGSGLPARDREEGPYPVYGSSGITGFHKQPLVEGPGIVVGRKGSIGTVYYETRDFFPIDTVFYVVPKSSELDLRFVYYLLQNSNLRELNTDSAVPGLNRNVAHEQRFWFPPLPIQRRIAAVLSAYDDLIEVNQQRIEALEAAAQVLYREWFVEFRFPGYESAEWVESELGEIPAGWELVQLGEAIELAYGKGLRKKDRVVGPYPVYGSSGVIDWHNEPLVQGPGIIVGRKGNVGSVFWSDTDFCPIDTVYYVITDLSLHYVFYNLQRQNFMNSDAAVPGLSRNQAYSLPFLVPAAEVMAQFEDFIYPVFDQIDGLRAKNQVLRETRDLLLPRLISGEVSVEGLPLPGEDPL